MLTKSARAALDRLDGVFDRAVAGDDDRDDVRIALDGRFDDRRAVDARQPQVGDDDVEGEIGKAGRAAASPESACSTSKSAVRQLLGDRLAQRRLVFDEQQMF